MSQRRSLASRNPKPEKSSGNGSTTPRRENGTERHVHEHELEHEPTHSHSHSIFSSHSHGEDGHNHGAEKILEALQGSDDPGSRITLIGLFSNVGLTAAKGVAGVYMHSASLLADAGHSLSDLLGDFVTLFCWRLSRKPPSDRYPYGFAKFETIGTTTVSLLLIGGALGIGFHSWHLLVEALSETVASMPPGSVQHILQNVTSVAHHVPAIGHSHVHDLDPNAAWFAAVSIVAKEWLYRATKKVADQEGSPVLLANAIHHRSDAYSSLVALFAILGSWFYPTLPLDPIGGLLVAIVILRQGVSIMAGSWSQLTDAGVSTGTLHSLAKTLEPLKSTTDKRGICAIRDLRARRAGSLMYVDLTAEVPSGLTVDESSSLENDILETLTKARKEITEVRVRFHPVHTNGTSY